MRNLAQRGYSNAQVLAMLKDHRTIAFDYALLNQDEDVYKRQPTQRMNGIVTLRLSLSRLPFSWRRNLLGSCSHEKSAGLGTGFILTQLICSAPA